MNLYKLDIRGFLFGSIKILILLLLFFGVSFTKINVTGSIYLYDLILVILFVLSLIGVNKIHISSKIFLFIIVGLIFVIFSMISENPLKFVLRQGMVIGYLLIIFFIYRKIKIWDKELIEFIITTSKLAFYIQVSYLIFLLINGGNVFVGFNYYSPAVVILFPVYSARILIYEKNTSLNFLQILFILLISTTIGHSSAFLAVLATVFCFFILKITPKQFLMALIILVVLIASMYFLLPQFQDVNANWRLYYWGVGIKNTLNTTLITGNGFGVPFITDDQVQEMINIFGGSNDFLSSPDEKYIKAFHNSFITIFFHIGIFSFLLIGPYIKGIKRLVFGEKNKELIFLIVSLLGMSVWVSFNVILELPHSSLIFWLVFLLTSNQLKIANEN